VNVLEAVAASIAFAAAGGAGAYAAARVCSRIVSFEDGPAPGTPRVALLIGAAALAGALEGGRGIAFPVLASAAMLCAALVGIWYCDVRRGIVPDVFTVLPLGAILLGAALFGQWLTVMSAAIIVVPFAVAAAASRGRGMGWGDVKLVALGGAVLGVESAILAFGVACTTAVIVALARRRSREPIAFAPYLVAAIALSLTIGGPR
jgi:prepilin signal peptidase PulO-like enzyme (type II secretory pathway)